MTITHRSWYRNAAIVLLGTVLILGVALCNGFPLVYSDTGTYLRSAFEGFVPDDRPHWYGVFIRHASVMGLTLWGVVVVQAALCAWLLWRCWRTFGNGKIVPFLIVTGVLSFGSGLGWYSGQLMADIFTPIGLLSGLLLLFAPAHPAERAAWALLMIAACWVHLSNLIILPLVLGATMLVAWRMRVPLPPVRWVVCLGSLIAAWPGLMLANRAADGEAYISRYSHVFMMGRLVETGILPQWLDEHCASEHYGICAYRDSLPTTSKAFLWAEESPLRRQGGHLATRAEYDAIISGTLREPKFLGLHIAGSLRSTVKALALWRVADELEGVFYREPYSAPYISINGFLPQHMDAYLGSAQNQGAGTLALRYVDKVYAVLLLCSIIGLVFVLRSRALRRRNLLLAVFAMAAVVLSAWVCATFSTVDSRFMARTAWLLPFFTALLVLRGPASPPTADQPFHT